MVEKKILENNPIPLSLPKTKIVAPGFQYYITTTLTRLTQMDRAVEENGRWMEKTPNPFRC